MVESGPLGTADKQAILDQLSQLDVADREITRAENAGIDMSSQKRMSKEYREKLLKIKNSYFPGS